MTNFRKVEEFHKTFGHEIEESPSWPTPEVLDLRVDLIEEELEELKEGLSHGSFVEVADALTDLLYVIYGMGHTFGIDLDSCFEEVHSSNMSKLGADGKPIYREDGKVLKGPNYRKPNLEKIIETY